MSTKKQLLSWEESNKDAGRKNCMGSPENGIWKLKSRSLQGTEYTASHANGRYNKKIEARVISLLKYRKAKVSCESMESAMTFNARKKGKTAHQPLQLRGKDIGLLANKSICLTFILSLKVHVPILRCSSTGRIQIDTRQKKTGICWEYAVIYIYIYIYIYDNIYAPLSPWVELSSEGSSGCQLRKARLFEWIELSAAVKRIYINKTNVIHKRLKKHILLCWFPLGCEVESWIGIEIGLVSIPASEIYRI